MTQVKVSLQEHFARTTITPTISGHKDAKSRGLKRYLGSKTVEPVTNNPTRFAIGTMAEPQQDNRALPSQHFTQIKLCTFFEFHPDSQLNKWNLWVLVVRT